MGQVTSYKRENSQQNIDKTPTGVHSFFCQSEMNSAKSVLPNFPVEHFLFTLIIKDVFLISEMFLFEMIHSVVLSF